jgi:hypothetical protein
VARDSKMRAHCTTQMVNFWLEKYILKNIIFRDVTTVLNERKRLLVFMMSVPGNDSLI